MSEPAASPGPPAVRIPERPPVEATDRRGLSPEEAAVPGDATPAEGPADTWEAPDAPTSAPPSAPTQDRGTLDALDRHIRALEDEIRRLKSG